MEVVAREMLEAAANEKPASRHEDSRGWSHGFSDQQRFDVAAWLLKHDVPIKREGVWGQDGYRWVLDECPWNGHTDASAYIVRFSNGAIAAGCHHDSCQRYGWRELRE